jgi:predicted transcriptional regulator
MSENDPTSDVAALTVQLLSAYLANNSVASENLADLIRSTRAALTDGLEASAAESSTETFTPAVSVKKSLGSPEHIISLIDGKPYKTLKRHLASHGLTPDTYRSRYNLPMTYPMVAPAYAAHRREVAQKFGLGNKKHAARDGQHSDAEPIEASVPEIASAGTSSGVENANASKAKPVEKRAGAPKSKRVSSRSNGDARPAAMDASDEAHADIGAATDAPSAGGSQPVAPESAKSVRKARAGLPQSEKKATRASKPAAQVPATAAEKSDDAVAPTVTNTDASGKAPKRRAKIGLFSKGKSAPVETGELQSVAPVMDIGAGTAEARKAAGQKKPKRMARSPKADG